VLKRVVVLPKSLLRVERRVEIDQPHAPLKLVRKLRN